MPCPSRPDHTLPSPGKLSGDTIKESPLRSLLSLPDRTMPYPTTLNQYFQIQIKKGYRKVASLPDQSIPRPTKPRLDFRIQTILSGLTFYTVFTSEGPPSLETHMHVKVDTSKGIASVRIKRQTLKSWYRLDDCDQRIIDFCFKKIASFNKGMAISVEKVVRVPKGLVDYNKMRRLGL